MGIVGELKQISLTTLEILRQNPPLVELFRAAQYLPESAIWGQTSWAGSSAEQVKGLSREKFERFWRRDNHEKETLKHQFLAEWEIPELDLDKSWSELTFFLAGYIPSCSWSWSVPELQQLRSPTRQGVLERLFSLRSSHEGKDFLNFLVVEKSERDGLPLVNAVGAGAEIGYSTGYGPVRYLLLNEIERVMNGLIKLSEKGLEERFWREAEKEELCPYIDWSDKEDLLEWMTELYNETLNYYQDAVTSKRAILLYLT